MSEYSTLSELARFVGRSGLSSEDAGARRRVVDAIAARLEPRPAHRRVTELLGAVLALSARTRRAALPRVTIELDAFTPGGSRAVSIHLPAGR